MRGSRLHGNDGGGARRGETLKPSHLVSFRLIPLVDWGRGFTLILAFSPQGRRDLTAFAGTTGESVAPPPGLSRWDGTGSGGVPWLRPGSDRVGVGLATLAGTLGTGTCGVCKWVTRATGRNRGLAAALESSYSFFGIYATDNCRVGVVCCVWRLGWGGASFGSTLGVAWRSGGSRTAPTPRQGSHPAFLQRVLVFGHFGRYPTSGARGCSGVIRSGGPPCLGPIWPDLAWFTPSALALPCSRTRRDLQGPGMRGSRLRGNLGIV